MTQTPLGVILFGSPWWVYLVLMGIVGSGYLCYKYSREERELEEKWIEKEGHVFMERLMEEKEKRASQKT
nr:sporulation YhaL family protein [Bacillus solitudinis]